MPPVNNPPVERLNVAPADNALVDRRAEDEHVPDVVVDLNGEEMRNLCPICGMREPNRA